MLGQSGCHLGKRAHELLPHGQQHFFKILAVNMFDRRIWLPGSSTRTRSDIAAASGIECDRSLDTLLLSSTPL